MKTISKKMARYGFFIKFFIILFISFIILLKYGIKVGSFELGGVNLDQLYIKLDKKLIVRAQNIKIPSIKKEEQKDSSDYLLSITDSAVWLDRLFEEISLNNVQIGDTKIKILYKDDIFFVDSPYFGIDVRFSKESQNGVDTFSVQNLALKDFNVTINGSGSADIKHKKYAFVGDFVSHELSGKIEIALANEIIRYRALDIKADSLKNFIAALDEKFDLSDDVKNWIYGYIIAQEYTVNEMNGKFDLKNENFYLNDLNATAVAKNLKVKFEKTLDAVDVEQANITLKDGKLYFDLINPVYQKRQLNGSDLVIYNIFDEKTAGLSLNIKTRSLYDGVINDILKAYGIKIPINQTAGKMDADLNLDIKFDTSQVIANGEFKPTDATIDIAGAKFKSKSADVKLINSDRLSIVAKDFGMDFFKADARTMLDLNTSTGHIKGMIKELALNGGGEEILALKDKELDAQLDFSGKETKLKLVNFGIDMSFGDENAISAQNGDELLKYSPLLQSVGVKNLANLSVKTKDFENLDIEAKGVKFDLPFYKKDGSRYDSDDFTIKVGKNAVSGLTASGSARFIAQNKDVNITTNDLNLRVDTNSTDEAKEQNFTLNLHAKNADIVIADINKTLPFVNFSATKKGSSISLNGLPKQGRVGLFKDKKSLNLDATDISGEFVNQLFGIQSFEGGKFRLKIVGSSSKEFKGEARFYGTHLRDYIFYQRLLSFLNSIPSLLSLKTPDFNDKGFTIENGKILFEKNGSVINFLAIELVGSSADIGGRGTIDLDTKKINIDLELKILKDASSIIDKIPLVNQIILGKDRSLSTVIAIRGTTDKPEYSTQVLQDTLLSPLKLIRNVLQAPFLIFE
ncbi:AsmA-like C-terminal domain-containing protein [Campylobacter curvus]|uniref:YhdP family protein n=1 Tax=Campylobacter curvus TaxID=200 RepID=UPI002015F014|nr:AsmA-like C-terminal domain-containing protein [Campylobacter curvus]